MPECFYEKPIIIKLLKSVPECPETGRHQECETEGHLDQKWTYKDRLNIWHEITAYPNKILTLHEAHINST